METIFYLIIFIYITYARLIIKYMMRTITNFVAVIFVALLLLVPQASSRNIHKEISLKQLTSAPQTIFLGRLGISNAGATIVLKYGLKGQTARSLGSLRAGIIHAQQFYNHKQATSCEQKQDYYHESHELKFFDDYQGMTTINIGKGRSESLSFLYIYTCNYLNSVRKQGKLTVDVLFKNKGRSLLQAGFLFLPYFILLALLLFAVFKYKDTVLEEVKNRNSIVSVLLTCSFSITLVTLLIKFILVVQMLFSSEQSPFLQSIYISLKVIVNVLVSSVLTAIAWGWLVNNTSYRIHYFSILILSSAINLSAELIGENNKEQISNEHTYQGTIGKVALIFKLIIAFSFISGCMYVSSKSNERRQIFINKFTVVGTFFILAHLFSLILSLIFSHNYRHGEVVPLIEDIIESVFSCILLYLFAYPKDDGGYETYETGLGYDMEQFSMIDRDFDEEQQKKKRASQGSSNDKKVRYEGKSPDLI